MKVDCQDLLFTNLRRFHVHLWQAGSPWPCDLSQLKILPSQLFSRLSDIVHAESKQETIWSCSNVTNKDHPLKRILKSNKKMALFCYLTSDTTTHDIWHDLCAWLFRPDGVTFIRRFLYCNDRMFVLVVKQSDKKIHFNIYAHVSVAVLGSARCLGAYVQVLIARN